MDPSFFHILAIMVLLPFSSFGDEFTTTCPSDFQCGSFNLTFPFTDFKLPICGLSYLDCTYKPFPRISLDHSPSDSQKWLIAESIGNSTITLHSELLQTYLSNKSCSAFYHQINLPTSPPLFYTFSNNITLFRCSKKTNTEKIINDSHVPGFGYYNGCDEDHIFYSKTPDSHLPDIGSPCTAVYLPYNKSFTVVQGNKSEDDVHEVFRLLGSDYDLQWNVSDDCMECRSNGRICSTDWPKPFRCVTSNILDFSVSKAVEPVIAIAFVVFILGLFLIGICMRGFNGPYVPSRSTSRQSKLDLEALARQCGPLAPKCYSYSDLKKITNSFNCELGKGGFGTVYKGKIPGGDLVAVKILNSTNGNDQDFINEVLSICRTSHVNVVNLLGFCIRGKKRALVYEYMANGSLEKYIYSHQNHSIFQLQMLKLYQISLGVARGLEYLHRGCNTRILHFDIKPHNILLDESFHPKISDFGNAKQYCTKNGSAVSSFPEARGTIGYIAPELISRCFGVVSHKSDVYSYGMMILEIVGRRKNVMWGSSNESEVFFPHWAYKHLIIDKDLRLKSIVDDGEEDEIAKKIILVGLWCIQKDPSQRPPMNRVIEMLEGNLEAIDIPPKPFFDNSPSSSQPTSFQHRDFVSGHSTTLQNSL